VLLGKLHQGGLRFDRGVAGILVAGSQMRQVFQQQRADAAAGIFAIAEQVRHSDPGGGPDRAVERRLAPIDAQRRAEVEHAFVVGTSLATRLSGAAPSFDA